MMFSLFRPLLRAGVALVFGTIAFVAEAQLFTVEIPPLQPTLVSNLLVAHGDDWHWRRGTNAPQVDWRTNVDAGLDATWTIAPGGFGYGDDAIFGEATRINPGMSNVHTTVYIRRTFMMPTNSDSAADLVLTVDYDDGFVAYLDGIEIARRNVPGAPGTAVANTATTGGISHEASCCQSPNPPVSTNFGLATNLLTPGAHVLAIVGVNQVNTSGDFHLIPDLALVTVPTLTKQPLVDNGVYALAITNVITLQGSNTFPFSVRVTVNGDNVAFTAANGTWSHTSTLMPGFNRFYLAAHDAAGNILTNITQDIVYEANTSYASGVLTGSNNWNDSSVIIRVTNGVIVPANASLDIGPGVVVIFAPTAFITATTNGSVNIAGTDESRAVFLPADTNAWGWLMANGSNAVLNIRYGDVVSGQVRLANRGTMLIEDSIIRDLPDLNREVIESVFGTELTVRRTYMTRFTEGDSQNTPVLVEGCLMEGFLVDGMDIKATNSPLLVRRSTFRRADPNNSNADAIDFGPGAGTVESCLMHGFPDKGVSIGGAPGTTIRNTLIYNCGIGISAYASSNLVIENTTVADCVTGVLFRDNPTRAVGVATNLIVWGNVTNVSVLNSSVLGIFFSDIDGTNYPGAGNISANPLFVDAVGEDYRLATNSPAQGAGLGGSNMGAPFPVGGMPSQPAALIARGLTNQRVLLSWEDTAENEDGSFVQRSTNGVHWLFVGAVAQNEIAFEDATVATGGHYYYRVRATNDVGMSEWSNRARASILNSFALSIERLSDTQVLLTFAASAGQSYTLQSRSSLSIGSWVDQTQIAARPTNSLVRLTNAITGTEAYFQLTVP